MVSTTKQKIIDCQLLITLIIRFKPSVSHLKAAAAIVDVIGTILEPELCLTNDSITFLWDTNVPLSMIITAFYHLLAYLVRRQHGLVMQDLIFKPCIS